MRRFINIRYIYCSILILLLCSFKKYDLKTDYSLLEKAFKNAESQVGVIELEENNSPEIKEYLKSINLFGNYPYCAAGIYWSFWKINESHNNIPIPKTGSAQAIFNYARSNGRKSINKVNKYDLIIWRQNESWKGHIEWIKSTEKAGWINTIGFNSKKNNKEGVFYQRRNIYHPLGRLKLSGLIGFKGFK